MCYSTSAFEQGECSVIDSIEDLLTLPGEVHAPSFAVPMVEKALDELPGEVQEQLRVLDELADEDIDLCDVSETAAWTSAERGKFYRGGAAWAAATGTDVVVIAHNAGRVWPARRFLKRPGEIVVQISEPFQAGGRKSSEINELCESWLHQQMDRLGRAA